MIPSPMDFAVDFVEGSMQTVADDAVVADENSALGTVIKTEQCHCSHSYHAHAQDQAPATWEFLNQLTAEH